MAMVGADPAELERAVALMGRAADDLDAHSSALGRQLGGLGWLGRLAEGFRSAWDSQHKPHLCSTSAFVREAAEKLARQAQQQREASSGAPIFGRLAPRTFSDFESKGSARADVVEAFWATGDPRRAEGDEFEIRRLENGNYVVVLPGVVDLTDKLDDVARNATIGRAVDPWYDGDQPGTARRMEYAISESQDTADSFQNPYALRVIEQMKLAGVPEGANVMFVGHSFGAYTAMELAGNEHFNSADGQSSGYHVNVTHVVAAGADTNWKLAELPDSTNALILNNRKDLAFRAEDGLVADVAPRHSGQVQIEFNGKSDVSAIKGAGHAPEIYAKWLSEATDRPELNSWLDEAGALYSGSGTRFSAKVPDIQ